MEPGAQQFSSTDWLDSELRHPSVSVTSMLRSQAYAARFNVGIRHGSSHLHGRHFTYFTVSPAPGCFILKSLQFHHMLIMKLLNILYYNFILAYKNSTMFNFLSHVI